MSGLQATALTCEYRENLLGTDVRKPRFGWKLQSDRNQTMQTAYRIQVAESESFGEPLWDTGRLETDQSIQIEYAGPEVRSRTRYYWRVELWDNHGRQSGWSDAAWWETGLLSSAEWQSAWITPDPAQIDPAGASATMLRSEFVLKPGVRSARIYATAAGVYEIALNGSRVGDEWMAPGWTSYGSRHQYQTYDVTEQVRTGANGIGIMVGNGWYKGELLWERSKNIYGDRRAALLQLHVQYEDGSEDMVATDGTWRASTGPILLSEIYDGEVYDARLEKTGWCEAGYSDADWCGTVEASLSYDRLVAQENWPVRITETIRPQSVIRTPQGDTVLDMGQNMVGRMRLTVSSVPAGTHIRLRHAEVLDQDGNFYTDNLRSAKQTVEYTAKGGEAETYAPYFSFQGFRYVQVEGFPAQEDDEVLLNSFVGEVMHSDMQPTGEFACSHPMINQLQRNIVWGQRGNFLDVPTDCPQRDERLGWTGDAQVFIRTAAFNYQIAPFFTKWLRDLKADQRPDGGVPHVIPDVLAQMFAAKEEDHSHSSAAWGDAATVCPWTVYLCYGDKRLLDEQYGSMKAWVEYMRNQGDDEYLRNTGFHFGDWLGLDAKENSYVGATPRDLIATAFYAHSTRLVKLAAEVLGREEDARLYGELLQRVVARFREEFITPTGRIAAPTQTAHVLALMFDLVDGDVAKRVARDLNELVVSNGCHLTTGFVGTPYLCLVLSDHGYHETAVKLLLQESYPSWLYSVAQGATTIWEHWDGIKPDGSFWSTNMNSYNHYAYGAIGDWMYRYVAGLDMDESEPGYKRTRIHPRLAGAGIDSARAALESPYGRIESGWSRDDSGRIAVDIRIPANTTAEVILPGAAVGSVRAEGDPAGTEAGEVQGAAAVQEGVRLQVGSGRYRFVYTPGDN